MTDTEENWWQDLYDDLTEDVLLVRESDRQTDATIDFILRHLEVPPGARIFDQCCGNGSLALPLAARGYEVHGVDPAASYIEGAWRAAAERELSATFVLGDAFSYRPAPSDGAFNWWTSFGYAKEDRTNLQMLQRAFEGLRPGGAFLLDTMNIAAIFRHFEEEVVTERVTRR